MFSECEEQFKSFKSEGSLFVSSTKNISIGWRFFIVENGVSDDSNVLHTMKKRFFWEQFTGRFFGKLKKERRFFSGISVKTPFWNLYLFIFLHFKIALLQNKGSLLALLVPRGTVNVHVIFPFHKRLFKYVFYLFTERFFVSPKWFFCDNTVKTLFWNLYYLKVYGIIWTQKRHKIILKASSGSGVLLWHWRKYIFCYGTEL